MADNFPMAPNPMQAQAGAPAPPPAPAMAPPAPAMSVSPFPMPPQQNQYGGAPINPFAGPGPAAPTFTQGVPAPPKMQVPGAVTASSSPQTVWKQPEGIYGYTSPSTSDADALAKLKQGGLGSAFPQTVSKQPEGIYGYQGSSISDADALAKLKTVTPQPASTFAPAPQPSPTALPHPSLSVAPPQPLPQTSSTILHPQPLGQVSMTPNTQLGQSYSDTAFKTSDIRAKTDVAPHNQEALRALGAAPTAGDDSSALDAAYARAGRDVGSRFAQTEANGWVPSNDLRQVKNYDYDYKDPTAPGAAPGRQTGGMAQEFQTAPVLKNAVKPGPDGKLSVDSGRVAMALPGAVGEVQSQVSKQQAQIDAMNAYIRRMSPREAEISQPPPEWSYKSSDAHEKRNIQHTGYGSFEADTIVPTNSHKHQEDMDFMSQVRAAMGGARSESDSGRRFTSSDATNKTNITMPGAAAARAEAPVASGEMTFPADTVRPNDPQIIDPWADSRVNPSGKVTDTSAAAEKKKKGYAFITDAMKAIAAGYNPGPQSQFTAPGVASPYAASDIRAKTDVHPVMPASYPAEPVGTRERALAAGYAWLAAHGDAGAQHHEAPPAPMPAEAEMAAAGKFAPKPFWPEAPTGMAAMQQSQFGLPTENEADMAALAQEMERKKREGR